MGSGAIETRPSEKTKKNCLSALKTRPHIGIVRKLKVIEKSHISRKQQQIMRRPMRGPLEIEIYPDASYTGRATMGHVGNIRPKNSAPVAVFHWSRKTIIRWKTDIYKAELHATKHTTDEILLWKILIFKIGLSKTSTNSRLFRDILSVRTTVCSPKYKAFKRKSSRSDSLR